MNEIRFANYHQYLKTRFGQKVYKITVDAGFSCPNRDGTAGIGGCIYCNNSSFNPNQKDKGLSITEQIKKGREIIGTRYGASKFLVYFQAFSNTYGPVEKLRSIYEQAFIDDSIVGIAVGTRPDCLQEDVLDLLGELAKKTYVSLEIGLQSSNDETLRKINRGHDLNSFTDAVTRARKRGLEICVHVILGLPGEDKNDMIATAKLLSGMDIQGVKVHALYVCKDTVLEKEFKEKKIKLLEKEEYVKYACDFLENLRPDIMIHRLASQVPRDMLVAPQWVGKKADVVNEIEKELARRNSRQGAKIAP